MLAKWGISVVFSAPSFAHLEENIQTQKRFFPMTTSDKQYKVTSSVWSGHPDIKFNDNRTQQQVMLRSSEI